MSEEIEKYIESKLTNSLLSKTSDKFSEKLMREIELGKEFEREDKKVNISVRYIISGFIILILSFAFTISYYLSSQLENENSAISSEYGTAGSYINGFFSHIFSAVGITFSREFFLYGILITVIIGLYSVADRVIFRKGY
jgi:hypothetical protein